VSGHGRRPIRCGLIYCSLFVLIRNGQGNSAASARHRPHSPGLTLAERRNAGADRADVDCTDAARRLMRVQADLVLLIEKRERLKSRESA